MESIFANLFKVGPEQVRHSYRELRVSYGQPHDMLIELIANAIDAIRRRGRGFGHLTIYVNAANRTLTVTDDGDGMDIEKLKTYLLPFTTDKKHDANLHGKKGVGLSYVLSVSNHFLVYSTPQKGDTIQGTVEGFADFISDDSKEISESVMLELKSIKNRKSNGTTVEIGGLLDNRIFEYSLPELVYLLRTKSTIGNTKELWSEENPEKQITIELRYIGTHGKPEKRNIPPRFLTPKELRFKDGIVTGEEWQAFQTTGPTDDERVNFLRNKIVIEKGQRNISVNNSTILIPYMVYLCPSRDFWERMTLAAGIKDYKKAKIKFQSAAEVSINGGPMDIQLPPPERQSEAGGIYQFYFLFDFPDAKNLDLGRKKLTPEVEAELTKLQSRLYREIFSRYKKYMLSKQEQKYDKNEHREKVYRTLFRARKEVHLKVPMVFEPKENSEVYGAFFMALSNGTLHQIKATGGSDRSRQSKHPYELYVEDGYDDGKTKIVECGYTLRNVLKTYNKQIDRLFSEIDWIAVWALDTDDKRSATQRALFLEETKNMNPFIKYVLRSPIHGNVYIIELAPILFHKK